ncbi:hypothetical protein [Marinobacter mangrovi]|uniref:hypothetical protein n=1 Tax=Marinobacter mangrovi TaxID=2803918 RepID=UPI00193370CF|nr:hypothetical protein [Marinobacter mangrovi]
MHRQKSTLKGIFILFFAATSLNGVAAEDRRSGFTCKNQNLDDFYSEYITTDATRYGGGLTSDAVAKRHIGKTALIGTNQFHLKDILITNPSYKISCYSSAKERDISVNHWSNFYGFGLDRKSIKVLHVYDPDKDTKEPYFNLEVVNGQLWEMYDGWLYKMSKAEANND